MLHPEQTIKFGIECRCCGGIQYASVKAKDIWDYMDPHRTRNVQDIFPYLSANEREMLISQVCGSCFSDLMKESEVKNLC